MPEPTWVLYPNLTFDNTGQAQEQVYKFWGQVLGALLASPNAWTCRGSAVKNVGTSTTPDGVYRDRAPGQTDLDGCWWVLQSPSGIQVCYSQTGGGGLTLGQLAVAPNTFENAGDWRNPPVSHLVRPMDDTGYGTPSANAWERESFSGITTDLGGSSPNVNPLTGQARKFHVMKRVDGEGFWVIHTDTAGTETNFRFMGVFKLDNASALDTKPYGVMRSTPLYRSGISAFDSPNPGQGTVGGICIMRCADGNQYRYSPIDVQVLSTSLTWGGLFDPWRNKWTLHPLILYANNVPLVGAHVRGCLPGIYGVPTTWATHDTINSADKVVFADLCFPWDGVTVPVYT